MEIDGNTYVEISATGHNLGKWVETQTPTCTAMGREQRVCEICDHFETRNVEAFGHDRVEHPAQSATCTEIGWDAYETCLRCNYTTYKTIPAHGHFYSDWVETIAPTCTKSGKRIRECLVCYNAQTQVVEKIGHDIAHHDARSASCAQIGWDAYDACSRCDYTTYIEIPKLEHSLGEWTQTITPTCLEKGQECRTCVNCEYDETREVAALNHDRIEYEAKAPTCTEGGWEAYEACSRCGYSTCVEIPETGHQFGEWFEFQAATCTANGEERRNCSNCEHYEARELETLGHTDANNDEICDLCEKNLSADSTTDDNDGLAPVAFLLQNTTNGRKILK